MKGDFWPNGTIKSFCADNPSDFRYLQERLSWLALLSINFGILLIVLEVILDQAALGITGRILQALGLSAFVLGNWQRIKGFDA